MHRLVPIIAKRNLLDRLIAMPFSRLYSTLLSVLFLDGQLNTTTVSKKTMCLVDSGLAFNSPYPAVIRPERNIDLIISFDFSQRDHDNGTSPFEVKARDF